MRQANQTSGLGPAQLLGSVLGPKLIFKHPPQVGKVGRESEDQETPAGGLSASPGLPDYGAIQ